MRHSCAADLCCRIVDSSSFRCFVMKSSNKDDASSSEQDEEDAAVFIYDRRAGSRPEEKIQLGGIFNFTTFKEKTRIVSSSFKLFKFIYSTLETISLFC